MHPKLSAPIPSTTRQTEILNTAVIAAPTGSEGVLNGTDRLSGSMVCQDPFTNYELGLVSSPHVVVMGMIGWGKSSLMKTVYGLRQLTLDHRRMVVVDKKPQSEEGEYAPLAHWYGRQPFAMRIEGGAGTRLNPLDPIITQQTGKQTQFRLLSALTQMALGTNEPLSAWETKALRLAMSGAFRAAEVEGRIPMLNDLVPRLGRIDHEEIKRDPLLGDVSAEALERLHQAGVGLRFTFEGVVLEEMAGLFDGPTSPWVKLDDERPLTSFDVSQLPDEGPSIPMVIAVANAWLLGMCRAVPGWRTTFLTDEGWHLVTGPAGAFMKSTTKLGRALGVSNVIGIHRPGDVPADSPGLSLLLEAETIHLYRQERSIDIDAVMSLYDLQPGSRETLKRLPKGEHLLKIGSRPEIQVKHLLSPTERSLIDTDQAMVRKVRA